MKWRTHQSAISRTIGSSVRPSSLSPYSERPPLGTVSSRPRSSIWRRRADRMRGAMPVRLRSSANPRGRPSRWRISTRVQRSPIRSRLRPTGSKAGPPSARPSGATSRAGSLRGLGRVAERIRQLRQCQNSNRYSRGTSRPGPRTGRARASDKMGAGKSREAEAMRIGLMVGATEGPGGTIDGLVATAKRYEQMGFPNLWMANIFGLDAINTLALIGRETSKIELGTAVVPTYPRHPVAIAQQALTTQAASRGRFALGIGLSHKVVIENMLGFSYDKPAKHMREYLKVLG